MITLLTGDALATLRTLPRASVQCCVTSPPYWGLRDYGTARWKGGDPGCDHRHQFRSRAERPKGALVGGFATIDAADEAFKGNCPRCGARRVDRQLGLEATYELYVEHLVEVFREVRRVLKDDGTLWLNLGDCYATKPGSLFAPPRSSGNVERKLGDGAEGRLNNHLGRNIPWADDGRGRNKRTVWTVTSRPFKGAHFATFPPALIEPCILAGSRPGDVVCDPFSGAATTGLVAQQHGRSYIGIELNPAYVRMARKRLCIEKNALKAAA